MNWQDPIPSPLDAYPGQVQFAWPFTLRHYKAWLDANKGRGEDGEQVRVWAARRQTESEGEERPLIYDAADWAYVLALVDLSGLENLPAGCQTDASGLATPYEVASWLIPLAIDYLNERLDPKKRRRPPG